MYFWNTAKLIDDLKHDRLNDGHFKNYYIASSIFMLLALFAIEISPAQNTLYSSISFLINLIVLLLATNSIYKVNGGAQGKDFLNRITSLMLPIFIKQLLIFIVLSVIVYTFIGLIYGFAYFDQAETPFLDLVDMILGILVMITIYWRIYVAVKKVNS